MGKKVKRSKKLDAFHYHEVADRAYLLVIDVEEHLLDHSAVEANKKMKKLVKKASRILAEVSQIAGELEFKKDKPNLKPLKKEIKEKSAEKPETK
jgi:histidyl-tRNA synthetase